MLVAGLSVAAGVGPEPSVVVASMLVLRHLVLIAGWSTGSRRLLSWLPACDWLARLSLFVTCLALAVVATMAPGDPAQNTCSAAMAAVPLVAAPVSVEVEGGRARIVIHSPVVLELSTKTDQDERLVMVICRLLSGENGKAVLTLQKIADAFHKNSRQDCQNHMLKFKHAGGSLAQMILTGRRGRRWKLHPAVLAAIASHWERNPLATPEQTHRWLAAQQLGDDVPLPSLDQLRATARVDGNLVRIRNKFRRLLEHNPERATVRPDVVFERLLEVVDAQAEQLREAGLEPVPMPGVVEIAFGDTRTPKTRPSKIARALMASLQALTTRPSPERDAQLCASIGDWNVSPLHLGALYCLLQLSIGQVAALVGKSKSVVYRGLKILDRALEELDPFPAVTRFSGVLGLDEKWLRIPKSFSAEEQKQGKRWRYAHFAVDAVTGDLLHVDVFDTSDASSVRAFLTALRAKGIRPKVVVTDMLAAYSNAIADTFGPGVKHHYCLFHHLQAVRQRLRDKFGADWKAQPLLRRLVALVDDIYDCKDRRTARKRLAKVLTLREELEAKHPEAVGLLDTIEKRFPKVANAIGRPDIPRTNNITERTIKAFNRHYKNMAGLESVETARVQLRLFRFFYRLTPMREAAQAEDRGKCPLERAGCFLRGIPLADYVRRFTQAWDEEGPELFVASEAPGGDEHPPSNGVEPLQAAA